MMENFFIKVGAFLVFSLGIFGLICRDIKRSIEGKENKQTIKKVYEYKRRQDNYDATPIDVKRKWLSDYTKNKVSDLARRFTKN